jgi:hypothetical protein
MSPKPEDELIQWTTVAPGEVTISVSQDAEDKKVLAKRYHDVTAGLRTMRFALEALRAGYKFDDEGREAKLKSLERAIVAIEKEAPLLQKLFLA